MSGLAALEAEILSRHRALQEKAQKTIVDAAALLDEGRCQGGVTARASFLEDSVQEVLRKADEEDREPAAERDVAPDDCEVANNVPASLRLQRVKIQDLEDRILSMQDALQEKEKRGVEEQQRANELEGLLEKEREKNKRQIAELEKLKKERDDVQTRVEVSKTEIRELKGRIADFEKEQRQLATLSKTKELRQRRVAEELERCKSSIAELKLHERETRDSAKRDHDGVLAENKRLERQKSELVVALRKQMKLIDILKRQKAHLEAAKLLSFTEEEFERAVSLNN